MKREKSVEELACKLINILKEKNRKEMLKHYPCDSLERIESIRPLSQSELNNLFLKTIRYYDGGDYLRNVGNKLKEKGWLEKSRLKVLIQQQFKKRNLYNFLTLKELVDEGRIKMYELRPFFENFVKEHKGGDALGVINLLKNLGNALDSKIWLKELLNNCLSWDDYYETKKVYKRTKKPIPKDYLDNTFKKSDWFKVVKEIAQETGKDLTSRVKKILKNNKTGMDHMEFLNNGYLKFLSVADGEKEIIKQCKINIKKGDLFEAKGFYRLLEKTKREEMAYLTFNKSLKIFPREKCCFEEVTDILKELLEMSEQGSYDNAVLKTLLIGIKKGERGVKKTGSDTLKWLISLLSPKNPLKKELEKIIT